MNSVLLLYCLTKLLDRISFQDPFQHKFLPEKAFLFAFSRLTLSYTLYDETPVTIW